MTQKRTLGWLGTILASCLFGVPAYAGNVNKSITIGDNTENRQRVHR